MFAGFLFSTSDAVNKCEKQEKQWRSRHRPETRPGWTARLYSRAHVHVACAGNADDVWVALSGLAVAAFTFTLWRSTEKLWRLGDTQRREDAARAFMQTMRQNSALSATRRAAEAAADQAKVARDEFLLVHRPRIHVRNIVVHQQDSTPYVMREDFFRLNEQVRGQFYIANRGDVDAWVTEILTIVRWFGVSHLPMERPYEGRVGDKYASPIRIPAGRSHPRTFASTKLMDNAAFNILAGTKGRLYVMGFVEYRDRREIIRGMGSRTYRTAYCRVFDPATRRFVPVEDADYEHEE